MDSASLTRIRTAAATGVAVRHLASSDADSAAIIGCGVQALDQLRAVHVVRPLRRATAFDVRPGVALQFAERASEALSIPVRAVHALVEATREIPIIVTCTTARAAFLGTDHVSAGALVAAVGADHPEKHEIQPGLMAIAAIITDVTAQCAAFGDLRHAIAAGVVTSSAVRAELGEVVAGVRAGRVDAAERIVFDSTGTALQDVAAAALVFERARAAGAGMAFDFEG
jgi:ornithine cyclodeaminase/alanine dehydrogenase-like protein (mu-crystallin family)